MKTHPWSSLKQKKGKHKCQEIHGNLNHLNGQNEQPYGFKNGEVFLEPADTRHPTQCCVASSDHNLPSEGSFGGDCFNGLIRHNLDTTWLWDRSQSPQLSSDLRAWSRESELLIICREHSLLETRPFLLIKVPFSKASAPSKWPRSSKHFLKRRLSAASLAASSWHLDSHIDTRQNHFPG